MISKSPLEFAFRITFNDFRVEGDFGKGYDKFLQGYLKKSKVRTQGANPHRYTDNPLEKMWALKFDKECHNPAMGTPNGYVDDLMGRYRSFARTSPENLEVEEKAIASAYQHLGSPVGFTNLKYLLCALPRAEKEALIKELQKSLDCQ